MKTRLLWMLILSVGSTALYCGLARPEVTTTPKRMQEYLAVDPATRPPIQLPPFVVAEAPARDSDAAPAGAAPENKR